MSEKRLRRIDYSATQNRNTLRRIRAPSGEKGKGGNARVGSKTPSTREEVRNTGKDQKPRPPKNKPGTFGLYVPNIPPALRNKMHALAKGDGVGVMELYKKAIEDYADSHKVKEDGGKAPKKKAAKKTKAKKADGGETKAAAPEEPEAKTEAPKGA